MIKLKKRQASSHVYHWRPNFRDYEALPDMRAVRTNIFVPLIFMTIALVCTGFILFREYRATTIRANIALLQSEIEADSQRHDEIVKLNGEFIQITRNLDEVTEFVDGQLVGSDFLLAVSSHTEPGMHLTRVEYGDQKALIEGIASVEAEEASRIVNAFLKAIEKDNVLQGLLTDYRLTLLERAGSSDSFKFRIEVSAPEKEKRKR